MHMTKWKKPIWKAYLLCDSNYRQNYENSKNFSGCQGLGIRWEKKWWRIKNFGTSENPVYVTLMVNTFLQTDRIYNNEIKP